MITRMEMDQVDRITLKDEHGVNPKTTWAVVTFHFKNGTQTEIRTWPSQRGTKLRVGQPRHEPTQVELDALVKAFWKAAEGTQILEAASLTKSPQQMKDDLINAIRAGVEAYNEAKGPE